MNKYIKHTETSNLQVTSLTLKLVAFTLLQRGSSFGYNIHNMVLLHSIFTLVHTG